MKTEPTATLIGGLMRVDFAALAEFCRANAIRRLSLYGSMLHGTATDQSDVDLLVEFHRDAIPGFFRLVSIERKLSDLFARRVDLRTAEDLSRHFRDDVLAKARVLYEAD